MENAGSKNQLYHWPQEVAQALSGQDRAPGLLSVSAAPVPTSGPLHLLFPRPGSLFPLIGSFSPFPFSAQMAPPRRGLPDTRTSYSLPPLGIHSPPPLLLPGILSPSPPQPLGGRVRGRTVGGRVVGEILSIPVPEASQKAQKGGRFVPAILSRFFQESGMEWNPGLRGRGFPP